MIQSDELEAQRSFDALIDRVERGEEFSITRGGSVIAHLIPYRDDAESEETAFDETIVVE